MPDKLVRAFVSELNRKADRRAPLTPAGAASQFGWSARDIAERLGVSERTARRWRQFNTVPAHRAMAWRAATMEAARGRARRRVERRGLSGLNVQAQYQVSRSKYRTRPDSPLRILEGNSIDGATMREVLDAYDQGDTERADELLTDALADAYGMGRSLEVQDVDSLDYRLR